VSGHDDEVDEPHEREEGDGDHDNLPASDDGGPDPFLKHVIHERPP